MIFTDYLDTNNEVSEKMMFENNGHIHVYYPDLGADSLPGIQKNVSVNLVVCCKIFLINFFVTVFHIQTYRRPI